jgi:hypothetical protein
VAAACARLRDLLGPYVLGPVSELLGQGLGLGDAILPAIVRAIVAGPSLADRGGVSAGVRLAFCCHSTSHVCDPHKWVYAVAQSHCTPGKQYFTAAAPGLRVWPSALHLHRHLRKPWPRSLQKARHLYSMRSSRCKLWLSHLPVQDATRNSERCTASGGGCARGWPSSWGPCFSPTASLNRWASRRTPHGLSHLHCITPVFMTVACIRRGGSRLVAGIEGD